MALSARIKKQVIDNLKKELAEAICHEESKFTLNSELFTDCTCYVSFIFEPSGTEFVFHNTYYHEKTGEILQRQVEMH